MSELRFEEFSRLKLPVSPSFQKSQFSQVRSLTSTEPCVEKLPFTDEETVNACSTSFQYQDDCLKEMNDMVEDVRKEHAILKEKLEKLRQRSIITKGVNGNFNSSALFDGRLPRAANQNLLARPIVDGNRDEGTSNGSMQKQIMEQEKRFSKTNHEIAAVRGTAMALVETIASSEDHIQKLGHRVQQLFCEKNALQRALDNLEEDVQWEKDSKQIMENTYHILLRDLKDTNRELAKELSKTFRDEESEDAGKEDVDLKIANNLTANGKEELEEEDRANSCMRNERSIDQPNPNSDEKLTSNSDEDFPRDKWEKSFLTSTPKKQKNRETKPQGGKGKLVHTLDLGKTLSSNSNSDEDFPKEELKRSFITSTPMKKMPRETTRNTPEEDKTNPTMSISELNSTQQTEVLTDGGDKINRTMSLISELKHGVQDMKRQLNGGYWGDREETSDPRGEKSVRFLIEEEPVMTKCANSSEAGEKFLRKVLTDSKKSKIPSPRYSGRKQPPKTSHVRQRFKGKISKTRDVSSKEEQKTRYPKESPDKKTGTVEDANRSANANIQFDNNSLLKDSGNVRDFISSSSLFSGHKDSMKVNILSVPRNCTGERYMPPLSQIDRDTSRNKGGMNETEELSHNEVVWKDATKSETFCPLKAEVMFLYRLLENKEKDIIYLKTAVQELQQEKWNPSSSQVVLQELAQNLRVSFDLSLKAQDLDEATNSREETGGAQMFDENESVHDFKTKVLQLRESFIQELSSLKLAFHEHIQEVVADKWKLQQGFMALQERQTVFIDEIQSLNRKIESIQFENAELQTFLAKSQDRERTWREQVDLQKYQLESREFEIHALKADKIELQGRLMNQEKLQASVESEKIHLMRMKSQLSKVRGELRDKEKVLDEYGQTQSLIRDKMTELSNQLQHGPH